MKDLQFHKVLKKIPLTQIEEELAFSKYKFSPKTLISIELESLKSSVLKLLDLAKKPTGPVAATKLSGPVPLKR